MKFFNILKFTVAALVILQVYSGSLERLHAMARSKSKTKGSDWADLKTYCYKFNESNSPGPKRWIRINKKNILNAGSGIVLKMYYENQSFDCPYVQSISKEDSKNRYFVPFYDMVNGAFTREKKWWAMRKFEIGMRNNVLYDMNIEDGLFSDDISKSELENIITTMQNNQYNHKTNVRTYNDKRAKILARIQDLKALKAKNIRTREELQAEVDSKQIELENTKMQLKDLMAKAEASRLQIRNYEQEINKKKTDELDPEMEDLQQQVHILDALVKQRNENLKKIQGIVPINQDDLASSKTKLKDTLIKMRATYLPTDPKYAQYSTLIAHLDTNFADIPNVISNNH